MLNELLKIIESNRNEYSLNGETFSYQTLKTKRAELISLGMKIGCCVDYFKAIFDAYEPTEKFSSFSLSDWGYYSPSILDNHIIRNCKKPKRLYNKPPKNATSYYKYYIYDNQPIKIDCILGMKHYSTTYFCYVGNAVYSFEFYERNRNKVKIIEVIYGDNNNILTFSGTETYGMPSDDTDKNVVYQCKNGVRAALLEYQNYHYENGQLIYADKYSRIYNFSPQINGYRFGERWEFVYDESGQIIDAKMNDVKPCVFKVEHPEDENFDPSGRLYEFIKKMGFI